MQDHCLATALNSENASGLLITHLPHIQWGCGFTGSNGFLIFRENERHLFTDRRYETQVSSEVRNTTIHIGTRNLVDLAVKEDIVTASDRLLIQPEYTTLMIINQWKAALEGLTLIPKENLLNPQVALKSRRAMKNMQEAQSISDTVFMEILPLIQSGIRERELAARIDYLHMMHGASGMSFETIVAFGENTALPHARPGNRILGNNEPILLDFGCRHGGYVSDMTRTLFHGTPGDEFLVVYSAVYAAQKNAIQVARAGAVAKDIDQAARSCLAERGLADYFSHSTGHGIGLEVHEWPRISATSSTTLLDGYTFTVEPGVYLPGKFGVRIEDTIAVGPERSERLSKIPRDFKSL